MRVAPPTPAVTGTPLTRFRTPSPSVRGCRPAASERHFAELAGGGRGASPRRRAAGRWAHPTNRTARRTAVTPGGQPTRRLRRRGCQRPPVPGLARVAPHTSRRPPAHCRRCKPRAQSAATHAPRPSTRCAGFQSGAWLLSGQKRSQPRPPAGRRGRRRPAPSRRCLRGPQR